MRTYALAVSVVFFSVGSFNLKSQTETRTYADAHAMFLLREALGIWDARLVSGHKLPLESGQN